HATRVLAMATRHRGFSLIPNGNAADTPSASCEITEQNSSIWVRADVVVLSPAHCESRANTDTDRNANHISIAHAGRAPRHGESLRRSGSLGSVGRDRRQ